MNFWDRSCNLLEYGLVALFIRSAVVVALFSEPAAQIPRFLTFVSGQEAIYVYAFCFGLLGLSLLYGKVFKKPKVHKRSLLIMFLISCYITSLAVILNGLILDLWLPFVAIGLTGCLYLRYKFRNEYMSAEDFDLTLIDVRAEIKNERN